MYFHDIKLYLHDIFTCVHARTVRRTYVKKKVRQEEHTSYAEDDTEDLVASTLREAEQWRTAIAEQEEQELQESQYQGHNSPLSDEEQHLGSTLLGYELRRMRTNVAPQLDSVLGYSEEPQ